MGSLLPSLAKKQKEKLKLKNMRLIKKLNGFEKKECDGTIIGVNVIRCKDYNTERFGHLILFSLNLKVVWFLTKIYISL